MERKLYKNQKNSIYKIAKEIGISKQNLYLYACKKFDISKMPMETLLKIAEVEQISPYDLYHDMVEYLGGE